MLFLFTLSYLFAVPNVGALSVVIEAQEQSTCDNLHNCRTIWNIIWSCLLTVFACTWVAVHPNIPDPDEKWTRVTARRIGITIMALIAPELVIAWAIRQRISARKLANGHRKYGWTMTHGFFAIMGGFMRFEDNKDPEPRTLDPFELEEYLKYGEIDITKEEIEDKSSGDILSKGIVVLQMGWFILQCIARLVEHLPITEPELVTLAFAALNFITYGLWWNKPLNVQRPYRVLKSRAPMSEEEDESKGGSAGEESILEVARAVPAMKMRKVRTVIGAAIQAVVRSVRQKGVLGTIATALYTAILHPFLAIAADSNDDDVVMAKRVATFYAGMKGEDDGFKPTAIAASGIAALFGAIHCAAWDFTFASHTERLLWRIASTAITSLPLLIPLIFGLERLADWLQDRKSAVCRVASSILETVLGGLVFISVSILGSILYIIARVTLLVLALISLRFLPAGAYQTVHWTTFIPHV